MDSELRFKVALKYGIAIELNDERTMKVLKEFVSNNGDVIEVYNSNLLKKIIKFALFKGKVNYNHQYFNYVIVLWITKNAFIPSVTDKQKVKQTWETY